MLTVTGASAVTGKVRSRGLTLRIQWSLGWRRIALRLRHRRRFHEERVRHVMLIGRLQDVVLQLGNRFRHLGVHALVVDVGVDGQGFQDPS